MTTPTPQDPLVLYGQQFTSRLLLGTSRYPSPAVLEAAVLRARPAMVTASLRRQGSNPAESGSSFWELLRKLNVPVLPNTAGCHSAQEAITTAQMAREVFNTPWIKLELIGDDYTLQPDTLNLVGVAEHLIKEGFQVLPYCTEDLVLCQRLVDVGCQAVMPWAAPIGTGRGPVNPYALQTLRERLQVPMLVDAGLGLPSHACQVMEWGFDGVLLNTAVALAQDPVAMAGAFADAVGAGRAARLAGAMAAQDAAQPSTPVLGTLSGTTPMHDTTALAHAILSHHAATFAGFAPEPVPAPTSQEPVYLAALQACSQLGFIAHDAECLARAWQARALRTGSAQPEAWPDAPEDFGLQPLPRAHQFAPCPEQLGLYAVLPDATWVGRMARAGVPTVQLRFKSDDAAAIEREVRAAVLAVQGTGALLFINDHWRVAIDAGAYGIHLGQEDLDALSASELQALHGSGLRLGVSTHGYAEMVRADAVGPSYIAMGAVFPTTLKKMATAPQGVGRLGVYARLMRHYPQVAIGGIGAEQFAQVLATGVGSIAVVRALVNAADPEGAAAQLMQHMAPTPT